MWYLTLDQTGWSSVIVNAQTAMVTLITPPNRRWQATNFHRVPTAQQVSLEEHLKTKFVWLPLVVLALMHLSILLSYNKLVLILQLKVSWECPKTNRWFFRLRRWRLGHFLLIGFSERRRCQPHPSPLEWLATLRTSLHLSISESLMPIELKVELSPRITQLHLALMMTFSGLPIFKPSNSVRTLLSLLMEPHTLSLTLVALT